MKICVLGLWHLGTVTAACLASAGHAVVGLDFDADTVQHLQAGQPPLFEPGLEDLVKQGIARGLLHFTTDIAAALVGVDVVWVTFDTPVDDDDQADVDFVVNRITQLFPYFAAGTLVLISSQLPVGTTRRLEQAYVIGHNQLSQPVTFGYSPENLQLGKAINAFTRPDRVVVGLRVEADRPRVAELLRPFTDHIEWMSVESAEMTKHALNAFLATSIVFINEMASLCEEVGADAKEVERGLKSEARIGPKAYLSPGKAFAGGTLARDIAFLTQIGSEHHLPTYLITAVRASNDAHQNWPRGKLQLLLGDLRGKQIAVWGLTYKPGTNTLRRSSSIELCRWLATRGAQVQAHDPAVTVLPAELSDQFVLCSSPLDALRGAKALFVATEWPEYQTYSPEVVVSMMHTPLVVDPNRFLIRTLGNDPRIRYAAVGKALA